MDWRAGFVVDGFDGSNGFDKGLNRSSDGSDSDFFFNALIIGFDGFFFF